MPPVRLTRDDLIDAVTVRSIDRLHVLGRLYRVLGYPQNFRDLLDYDLVVSWDHTIEKYPTSTQLNIRSRRKGYKPEQEPVTTLNVTPSRRRIILT